MSRVVPSSLYYGWIIVAVAFLINVASAPANGAVFSFFVTPMSEDLGWSKSVLSWGFTARLAVAGLSAPFLGGLIDRFGARTLGVAAGLSTGLSIMALAAVQDVWLYYVLSAVSGISGFGAPVGQLLTVVPVSKWFHANRAKALAISTVGLPLGTTVALPVTQQLIAALGWRETWALAGGMIIALTVVPCWLLMRKDPESMGLEPEPPAAPAQGSTGIAVREVDWTLRQVFRNATVWLILASMALNGMVLIGTVVYRVSFWEDIGLSPSVVAFGTALDPLTVSISCLFFGLLAARMQVRYMGLIAGIGVAVSMVFMVAATDSVAMLLAYNLIWGSSMGANITVNNVIWPNYYGLRFLGTIRGVVFPVSVATAALSAPLFALMLDAFPDPRYVWLVTLIAFVGSGLLLFVARPPQPRRPQEAETLVEALATR
jgi:MFS family permease